LYDRTDEQLCSADGAVIRVRQLLLKAAREFLAGKTPTLADNPELDYAKVKSVGGVLPASSDWRSLADST
jgi:phthalate 4,5-dioxygenase oxygenase subunit